VTTATLTPRARAVRKWIERCGGSTPLDGIYVEFLDRRGRYGPEDVSSALGELERAGEVRWRDFETLELIR